MQISALSTSPSKASFLISKAGDDGLAIVNALRRAVITQLPSFAVEDITIYENNSALYNEYIAGRIGLVPLTYDEDVADDAKISFTLAMDGPCTVYSRDLKPTDETIKVYSENVALAVLGLDQKLRLEAVAVKGTGKRHAKFQCAHASYAYFSKLVPSKKVDDELVVHEYPATDESVVEFARKHPELCDFNLEYVKVGNDTYTVECREDEFLFYVESYNNVDAQKHFWKAVEMLSVKASELAKEMK